MLTLTLTVNTVPPTLLLIEPRTLHVPGKPSTTELHPQSFSFFRQGLPKLTQTDLNLVILLPQSPQQLGLQASTNPRCCVKESCPTEHHTHGNGCAAGHW